MARPLRIQRPGGWYHVTARGNERRAIFREDLDRGHFCELLAAMVERFVVRLHTYVLMDNHYHLMVETPQANLSQAIQWLNVSYSAWFNRRYARVGHLFQGRYQAVVVEHQAWALSLSRYVHLNPVRIGVLGLDKAARDRQRQGAGPPPEAAQVRERIGRLRRYRWSSYRAYVGFAQAPSWLERQAVLGLLGSGNDQCRRQAYREYVESAVRQGLAESPWEGLVGQVVLGGAEFVQGLQGLLKGNEKEQPGLRRLRERPGWEQVVRAVEKVKGERWEVFRDRQGDWGRDLALYLGRKHSGMKLAELGAAAGGLDYRTVGWAVARFGQRVTQDRSLAELMRRAEAQIKNPEM